MLYSVEVMAKSRVIVWVERESCEEESVSVGEWLMVIGES